MMTGVKTLPNAIPNLNQRRFRGVNILEFNKPRTKKNNEIAKDQILTFPSLINGYKAISKNTIKKTIPKLLFEPTFILSI